jgi:hypothetical protein
VLGAGLSLATGQTPLLGSRTGPSGDLHLGFRTGRVILGAGLRVGAGFGVNDSSTAIAVHFEMMADIQVTVLRSSDARLELALAIELGGGTTGGHLGPGFSEILGLPPGSQIQPDNLQFFAGIGPLMRYWFHPQLAVSSSVLLRGDLSEVSQPEVSFSFRRFDVNVAIGLGLTAVFFL